MSNLRLCRSSGGGGMVSHSGDFYQFGPLQMSPTPQVTIPILIGGHSTPALKRAARHDGWIGACYEFDELVRLIETVKAARILEVGNLKEFRIAAGLFDPTVEQMRKLSALGLTDYIKPSWMKNGRAAKSSLTEKKCELDSFLAKYGCFFNSTTKQRSKQT